MTTHEEWRDPHTGETLHRRIRSADEHHDPGDEDEGQRTPRLAGVVDGAF